MINDKVPASDGVSVKLTKGKKPKIKTEIDLGEAVPVENRVFTPSSLQYQALKSTDIGSEIYAFLSPLGKIAQFTEAGAVKDHPDLHQLLRMYIFPLLNEEVTETQQAFYEAKDEEIIDGLIDVAFIARSAAYILFRRRGFTPEESMSRVLAAEKRVADANLAKHPFEKNEKGKIIKPEGWTPPEFSDLFELGEKDI